MSHRFVTYCNRTHFASSRPVLAGIVAAVVAAALGVAAPALAARSHGKPDATPSCGGTCASYYVAAYGQDFVLRAGQRRPRIGAAVRLGIASNSDAREDWAIWPSGTVGSLARLGLVSRRLALHFRHDQAFELEYAPNGFGSGTCLAAAHRARANAAVSLQWCGQSGRTIWIIDAANESGVVAPLISGAGTNFSDPQVLTAISSPETSMPIASTPMGMPTWRKPLPDLVTYRLQTFAAGTVFDSQMWADTIGVLP
jgi:hypothetical protein